MRVHDVAGNIGLSIVGGVGGRARGGRGLHSSTFQLNPSRFCDTKYTQNTPSKSPKTCYEPP
jgi:hypothetical protein